MYTERSGIVDEDNNDLLTCALVRSSEMDFATDDDVRGTVRRLAHIAATRTSGELKLRERACGYNHNMHNMLLDPALDNVLKPATHFAHDWMHTLVVHGAWNTLMFAMLTCLIAAGVKDAPAQLSKYISEWTLPARLATSAANFADILSTHR